MTSSSARQSLAVAALVVLAACSGGGGGGGSTRVPHPSASPSAAATSGKNRSVSLQLKIPKRATLQALARGRKRAPKWISASTEGAAVTISDTTAQGTGAGATSEFNLTPGGGPSPTPNGFGTSSCTQASDGSETCTMLAPAPALGTNLAVQVTLYDTPPPFGATNQLATGYVATTLPLTEGANVVVPLVLSGIVSTVSATDVVPIPASGGTGSFLLQGVDADGNIILASDGAAGASENAATFNLSIPASIASATLTDATTTAAGSGATILNNANLGDTITVAVSGTPGFVGIPIDAVVEGGASPVDLGPVYVPVSPNDAAPINVMPSPLPSHPRIAGATFASSFNNGPTANGFIIGFNTSGFGTPPEIAYYTVSGSTSPTSSLAGSFTLDASNGFYASPILDIVAAGNANYTGGATTASIYFDVSSQSGGNELWTLPLNAGNNGGSFYTADYLSATAYGVNAFTASEDAGGYVGTAVTASPSGADANIAAESGPPPAQNLFSIGSTSPISIAATINGTAQLGENPEFVVLAGNSLFVLSTTSTTPMMTVTVPSQGGAPVSLVASGPNVDVLTSGGEIYTCLLSNTGAACTYNETDLYEVSTDRHAMALGPDGKLWIATGSGIERYDAVGHAINGYGTRNYDQIVPSADGRLYATVAGSGEVDAIP